MEMLLPFATLIITFCLCFYFLNTKKYTKNLPHETGGAWPLIGQLPLLWGPELHHIILSNMADKYGPIFSIRLGVYRFLIVSGWEVTKECFANNDLIFSNRPKTTALQHMTYDFAMFGFNVYSSYWREMRKLSMLKLLSKHRVSTLGNLCVTQIRAWMTSLYSSSLQGKTHASFSNNGKVTLEMKEFFGDLTFNLMVRIVAGDIGHKNIDLRRSEKWREAINEFFRTMGVLTIPDVLPSLKWLDYFGGTNNAFKKTGKELDSMLETWLQDHKKHKKIRVFDQQEGGFMAEMMDSADIVAQEFPGYDADTISKATCQTMMVGGTDPVAITLTWALSLLLNNRHTLKTAQQELDIHIGRERHLQESDMQNLLYIKAIIKETLRLYPPAPLSPPREAVANCVVAGHHIPVGTRLIVNIWKLHRDPRIWSDPLGFRPERFLTNHKEVDVGGQHFELLPFGAGRRACPGVNFALQIMELGLAIFLHEFDIETLSDEMVDMTGSMGTANVKATPLEVVLKPRLSPLLYD